MLVDIKEKLEFLETCETGYVTDALNLLGIKNCWIDNVLPLASKGVVAGQVFNAKITRIRDNEKRYTLYDVAEATPKGRILVYAGAEDYTILGENISTLLCNKGIKAVVLDGRCRDVDGISSLSMPVFCKGPSPRINPPDLQITELDVPVIIGGIKINPGDIIIGDSDGVVLIPLERLDEVLKQVKWVSEVEKEAAEALGKVEIKEFEKIIFKKKKPRL